MVWLCLARTGVWTHLLDCVPPGGDRQGLPQLLPELAAPHVHPGGEGEEGGGVERR